jgi:hypothetical protein
MKAQRLVPVLLIPLVLSILPLAAQEAAGNTGAPPRLAGILDLSFLSSLWGESPGSSDSAGLPDSPGGKRGGRPVGTPEPLDIATTADGPVLLFSDRILSLGVNLEMTTRTVQDLTTLPRLPDGVIPSRLLLNPLAEPVIYDDPTGELFLLHRDGSDPERFETELPQAVEAQSLKRGGVLLSDGKSLSLFTRRGEGLTRREIPLPAAFTTGLSVDAGQRLWVYDLVGRQVRVFDLNGKQLFAISPDISGANLLFPQVFQARPDGGFFLGTAGELWCFAADGSVRWRLSQFSAGIRQALPAFYRLAVGRGEGGPDRSFYILDPLGNRILKFIENPPGAPQETFTIEAALAEAFQSSETWQSRQNETLRLCLERELYLQAAFFRRSGSDDPVVTDLSGRLLAKQAGLLSKLAGQLEDELRYAEAEGAYNRALSLYRELRSSDPVDPRYPEAIRELSEKRNTLRQIRVAEGLLTARLSEGGMTAGAENTELRIAVINGSDSTAQQVEVLASFSGYSASRWRASLGTLRAGGRVTLTVPLLEISSSSGEETSRLNAEDLYIPCNLLVRYAQDYKNTAEHFRFPLVFPAGTLRLPEAE